MPANAEAMGDISAKKQREHANPNKAPSIDGIIAAKANHTLRNARNVIANIAARVRNRQNFESAEAVEKFSAAIRHAPDQNISAPVFLSISLTVSDMRSEIFRAAEASEVSLKSSPTISIALPSEQPDISLENADKSDGDTDFFNFWSQIPKIFAGSPENTPLNCGDAPKAMRSLKYSMRRFRKSLRIPNSKEDSASESKIYGNAEIKAPITGYIGKALVTEGNYVNSTTQNLARIVQVDPIRVAFSVADKDFLNMREQRMSQGSDSIKTEIVLPNGKVLINHLKSRFNDNEINSDTATIAVYAEYNNKDNLLIPGNYVDIRLGNKEDKMAILVPQASVAQDKHGNYVMVVGDDNIAYERRVVMGDTLEDKQIVLDGLKADERVIIQGLQKVSNGQKVQVGEIANNSEKVTVEGK